MYSFRKAHHSHTSQKAMKNNCCKYIYIYIHQKNKPTLFYVTTVNIKKSHIFPYRYILELYSFVSVCVCVSVCVWCVYVYIYVLFSSLNHAETFEKYLSSKHPNINFSLEKGNDCGKGKGNLLI